ncbi:MAG: DNA translocase FtsK, partial [Anaerovoracaceae bacterium]
RWAEDALRKTQSIPSEDIPKFIDKRHTITPDFLITDGKATKKLEQQAGKEYVPAEPLTPNQQQIIDLMTKEGILQNSKPKNKDVVGAGAMIKTVEEAKKEKARALEEQMNKKKMKETIVDDDLKAQLTDSAIKKSGKYTFPPLDLLTEGDSMDRPSSYSTATKAKAIKLEETLKNFKVDANVVNVTVGPSITRFEIQPNTGVKVSSIVRLENDIALNMEARSMRIEAPIPGKAAVGIEVENAVREMVTLRDIIGTKEFKSEKSKLTFSVGMDIEGKPIVADLAKMPHMLIAGATGSGKSVCINSILMSLLYKASPDEVKLVLIDPKMVELKNYNGIPHLLIPVVTDPTKAAAALNWAVAEMTQRYKKFSDEGCRDMHSYNSAMKKQRLKEEILPQIVVVIDELADLMMVASSQVEDAICRLAQMARAAGIHLIVATQRPSVDVITGLIKANIPSRIAFMVSSSIDSRTILDMTGAEKLVGNGDMLFSASGISKPKRVQGTFVSDGEVRNVIEFIKKAHEGEAVYHEDIMETIEKGPVLGANGGGGDDQLFNDAVDAIISSQKASVSYIQRRFRLGYNRAAGLMDEMEEKGIVGPSEGSKPRQLLINELQWNEMKEK